MVVFVKNAFKVSSCARLVKVFIVVALCEVWLQDDSSSNLSVCVGFLDIVVRSSLLSRLNKQSRKESFPFSSISLVNWMSAFCSLRWSWKASISSCERR